MTELTNRGVQDILIAGVNGIKGFPEAITSVFSQDRGPGLHRTPDPLLDAVLLVEGTSGGGT